MLLFACAVATFLPTQNANTSLTVQISNLALQSSFVHLSWIYNHTPDVCLHNLWTRINAALLLCNTEAQTVIPVSLLLRGLDCSFETQPCGCHALTTAMWVPHGLFEVMENILKLLYSECLKPCFFLNTNDLCHRFPESLASFTAFIRTSCLPVKQFNLLICWPGEHFSEDSEVSRIKAGSGFSGRVSVRLEGCEKGHSGFRWSRFLLRKCLNSTACPNWRGMRSSSSCCHPTGKWQSREGGQTRRRLILVAPVMLNKRDEALRHVLLPCNVCGRDGRAVVTSASCMQHMVVPAGSCCITYESAPLHFKGDHLSLIYSFLLLLSG